MIPVKVWANGTPENNYQDGTQLEGADFESWNKELVAVVEASGIAPDAEKFDQLLTAIKTMLRGQLATAVTSAGAAPAYTLTPSPALTALTPNTRYRVKFHGANAGGASTLAVSGLVAKSIKQYGPTGTKINAIITAGQLADVEYDGVDFVILDPLSPSVLSSNMRNRLINGAMKLDQRNNGTAKTYTAGAVLAYGPDRWYGYCIGANVTGQQVTLPNSQMRYRFSGAAGNTAVGFGQRIEAANCLDLAGQTATLQAKLSSSSLAAITWTAYYANTADAFGTLASPTRTQIATGVFAITADEATYHAQISIPEAAVTGIEIVLSGGALLAGQTLTIGDMQFEAGSIDTPFENRLMAIELALAQRYFESITLFGNVPICYYPNNTGTNTQDFFWKVRKRTLPASAVSNATGARLCNYGGGVLQNCTAGVGDVNYETHFNLFFSFAAQAYAAGHYIFMGSSGVTVTADAEL